MNTNSSSNSDDLRNTNASQVGGMSLLLYSSSTTAYVEWLPVRVKAYTSQALPIVNALPRSFASPSLHAFLNHRMLAAVALVTSPDG